MTGTGSLRRFNVRVPMRDSVTLSADITIPADNPAPAVVLRTPYGKSGAMQSRRADMFASGGYAAVLVDVRGRGDSDGEFAPYRNDGPDGFNVIEWVAAQPWCSGAVATSGASYGGHVQWLTALERPPSLRAMISVVTPSDPFVEWPTGLPSPMSINWFRHVDGRVPQHVDDVDWMAVYRHRPLLALDEAAGFSAPHWREELAHRTLDSWWEPHRYQHRIGEIDLPVLHISGWYDDEQVGTPLNFAAMVAAGRRGQRLLMGPWGHAVNTTRTLGEVDFGAQALIDLDAVMLGFLDEHLRDRVPDAPDEPVRLFLMGANCWLSEAQWPPADCTPRSWWLDSDGAANSRFGDGRLVEQPVATESSVDTWTHDPDRPVPFITGAGSGQIGGPDDYAGVESRGDVLVFTTEAFTTAYDLIGPVRLRAHVATTARDGDVTAKLLDVHPNGFAQRLCDGVVRLRYRSGMAAEVPVEPDDIYEVDVDLWNTCQRVLPGHRLRVEVAASAFPKYDVNLGTGGDMVTEVTGVPATCRLWHDANRPSRLVVTGRQVPA